ncbi:hypothetical protein ACFZDP_51280 [Streptomyces mirabilis]|uniref:hypothetical protein n=1 Tax=Streptomyces mirabilis TaxID=68239 RepID=UPI0036EE398E
MSDAQSPQEVGQGDGSLHQRGAAPDELQATPAVVATQQQRAGSGARAGHRTDHGLGGDPHTLKFTGEDKDMTLDELDEFVKAARAAGVPGGNPVRAELSMSRKIKEVEIVGCRAGGSRRVAPCTFGRRLWGVSTFEVGLRCGLLIP